MSNRKMVSYFYYEVIGMDGNRICMCGSEADARMMMLLGPDRRWVKCQFLPPNTVSTTAETVGEKSLQSAKILQEPQAEPFNPVV